MSPAPEENKWLALYDRIVLGRPRLLVAFLLLLGAFFAYQIRNFRLDASADSIVLEHDRDLRYYRKITDRYSAPDFLFITYLPDGDLLGETSLEGLKCLRGALRDVPGIESITTLLDVPLLQNPPVPFKELKDNIKTLESPDIDLELARRELAESPIFRELLVSSDLESANIQVNLATDPEAKRLLKRKTELLGLEADGTLTPEDAAELEAVKAEYDVVRARVSKERHQVIMQIRRVMGKCDDHARLFLGGVAMISDDMISFIKYDLRFFGVGMALFLISMLGVIFRRKRWVLLPMLCCAYSALAMMGLLGTLGWEVTVISSNFISLQLIMTMAIAIHLVVRYTELLDEQPDATPRALMAGTVRSIFKPCLFTTATTIAGFSSLVFCDILPVINFGWMMSMGLTVSLVVCYLLFPALLMLMRPAKPRSRAEFGAPVTALFAKLTDKQGGAILFCSAAIVILTIVGISRLEVENSFIDYFRESTEIYRGMKFIDDELGGTTPLDVVIEFPEAPSPPDVPPAAKAAAAVDDDFGDFEDEFAAAEDDEKYWYTPEKLADIQKVHEYLEAQPEIGKVLSLHTLVRVAEQVIGEGARDGFNLKLLFNELPEDFKKFILYPYVSVEHGQARVSVRIKDSMKSLRRNELLHRIEKELGTKVGLPEDRYRLTSMMVLYNNMLQSLFQSQIRTIGITVIMLLLMFLVQFRSPRIAFIALMPNLCASLVVPGVMGLCNIPLDMMTITIVAISVGIAVDDTIHYIHRFRHEFEDDGNYVRTMYRCHASIGNAMYYTSITIVVGFSILAFSNFIPSVLFGLLTGLAMVMALLAALSLLPRLIVLIKPFGPERAGDSETAGS